MRETETPIATLMQRWLRIADLAPLEADEPNRLLNLALDELSDVELMIARTKPQSPRDVAILAALAWRLHNENGLAGEASRRRPDCRINDHALGVALANLARATANSSGSDTASVHEHVMMPPDLEEMATRTAQVTAAQASA